MLHFLSQPWPWYVAGPLIGLLVPLLLVTGGKLFGVSSNLRHICAAVLPCKVEFFRYDWKKVGLWNLVFVGGVVLGGVISVTLPGGSGTVAISQSTIDDLRSLGLTDFSGYAPPELISWHGLTSLPGFIMIVVGGLLVGFGARYAGGCTSGHAISGLASLQFPSLVAVVGFFAGGLFVTYVLLPLLL